MPAAALTRAHGGPLEKVGLPDDRWPGLIVGFWGLILLGLILIGRCVLRF